MVVVSLVHPSLVTFGFLRTHIHKLTRLRKERRISRKQVHGLGRSHMKRSGCDLWCTLRLVIGLGGVWFGVTLQREQHVVLHDFLPLRSTRPSAFDLVRRKCSIACRVCFVSFIVQPDPVTRKRMSHPYNTFQLTCATKKEESFGETRC